MQRRLGPLSVESVAAESPKFTAPLLLVHGLWCSALVWRKFMGYLAHRGWICHAVNLRDADRAGATTVGAGAADYAADLQAAIAACAAPPIVVGHDLGGLLALRCRASDVRAAVALAPVVPAALATAPNRALQRLAARVAWWCSRSVAAPHGALGAAYFGGGAPGGTAPDSSAAVHELCQPSFPLACDGAVPKLIIAGERDQFSVPRDVATLAARVGADCRCVAGATHAMPWEPGWERRVAEVHRWLIQMLGESLLLPREEEDE